MRDIDLFSQLDLSTKQNDRSISGQASFSEGFSGLLTGVNLADIVQLACLENKERKLIVQGEKGEGIICFKDGEVIHAETQNLKGEDAFYEIMSWNKGTFRFIYHSSKENTIQIPWNFLIIEALRIKDEKQAAEPSKQVHIPEVLVVDDSKFFVSRLRHILRQELGANVTGEASNGKRALEFIAQNPPDLITLDINMPVMAGDVALKHIMIRSPAPVVLISNFNDRHTAKIMEFLRLGAVDFIGKPVGQASWDLFKKRIRIILDILPQLQITNIRRAKNPKPAREKTIPGIPAERLVVIFGGIGGMLEIQKILPAIRLGPIDGMLVFQAMCPQFIGPFSKQMEIYSSFSVKELKTGAPILSKQAWFVDPTKAFNVKADELGAAIVALEGGIATPNPTLFLKELASIYRSDIITVVLSGAGEELVEGLHEIADKNGYIILQDPDTCLHPEPLKHLATIGLANKMISPEEIAKTVNEMLS